MSGVFNRNTFYGVDLQLFGGVEVNGRVWFSLVVYMGNAVNMLTEKLFELEGLFGDDHGGIMGVGGKPRFSFMGLCFFMKLFKALDKGNSLFIGDVP